MTGHHMCTCDVGSYHGTMQQALQLYCPFDDTPELDPLHEDIGAAKDDLYLAKSSVRWLRTWQGDAKSTFVTFSFVENLLSTAGRFAPLVAVATGDGDGREHSVASRVCVTGLMTFVVVISVFSNFFPAGLP